LKINNSKPKGVALWESIKCCCGVGVVNSFPLVECSHCRFQKCWDSVPQKNFTVNNDIIDKNGKITKKQNKTVSEITLVRGSFDDVIGWTF
tara:strand:+ start:247 stop:519 length:273 start_codon:yes stop_codon:yes gene_type:complete